MSRPRSVAAGALVALCGAMVLTGWLFDFTPAKSLMVGWRVMVPVTATSFFLAGLALLLASRRRGHEPNLLVARAAILACLVLPGVTFVEYMLGVRTGVEGWLGVSFDAASPVAGRMSPLTSLCFVVVGLSMTAATLPSSNVRTAGAIGAGATLLITWLAILAVVFDIGRLNDVPRFPGTAVLTIALMAIVSASALELALDRDYPTASRVIAAGRFGALLAAAFAVPLILGWIRGTLQGRLPAQVVTALLVFLLAAAMAAMVWKYARRLAALTRERERAFIELEERVAERTQELAARNDALRRSEDLLREADRRKDEFLATLAHELRTPLAPIRSAAAALRSDAVSDDDKRDARVIIDRQVTQMARLIDDLLDVSRITAGKLPMRMSRLGLADILHLAVDTVRPQLDQAHHRFTISLPHEPITIEADEARLSQVFANLLHNACKYTEPGGEIRLTASLPNEAEVEVAVRDNGIGIPPEFLPRLFDKFSQVAPALDRSQGGLGLGLSLVQGIVVLHGGRVEARSPGLGRGSEFIVRLPVVTATRPALAPPGRAPAERPPVSRRVLVVDDNADSAESMALLLRLDGHVVETANDGEVAIQMAERLQPHAILLDIGMPRVNGFEVCERIRSRPWGRSVLMVAQTGWGQSEDRARTLEAGFDAHLTKPVDPAVVQDLLASFRGV